MDYYSTLGVARGASQDEIKKAYRSLAMKHHPDRGGDEKKFKEVEEAYRILSDPDKKSVYDMGGDPSNPHGMGGFDFNSQNFNDVFQHFGFGFRPRQRKNQSLGIAVTLTLEDVLKGRDIDAEISTPNGNRKLINIKIPAGVEHGQQIRYQGMGDQSIPNLPPGDLIVNIQIQRHARFHREHQHLVCEQKLSVWDLILGSDFNIKTLDGRELNVTVPEGTQPDTLLQVQREGLPNMKTGQKGNLLIKIKVDIPKNLTNDQKQKIRELKNGI